MDKIQYLKTKIKVGGDFKGPDWDFSCVVGKIQEVTFVIEDSDISYIEVVFEDSNGRVNTLETEWHDSKQGFTLNTY